MEVKCFIISSASDTEPVASPTVSQVVRPQSAGRESHFTVEKPDKHDLSQVIKVNVNSDKTFGSTHP